MYFSVNTTHTLLVVYNVFPSALANWKILVFVLLVFSYLTAFSTSIEDDVNTSDFLRCHFHFVFTSDGFVIGFSGNEEMWNVILALEDSDITICISDVIYFENIYVFY